MPSVLASYGSNTTLYLTVLSVALPVLLLCLKMLFSRANKFPVAGRTIIITGGSQGLGLSLANKLAARGGNVVIVAREEGKLASALTEIKSHATSPNQRFLSLSYDLTLPESAPAILKQVTEWNDGNPPDIVWCCAGYCIPGFFADIPIETLRSQMDTLYWTCAYVAHATLNLWKTPLGVHTADPSSSDSKSPFAAASKGANPPLPPRHLIFTCSSLVCFPIAGYAPYTPAKSAMRALADSLQHEIALYNGCVQSTTTPASQKPAAEIKLHTILPMGIFSPNFERESELKPSVTKMLEETDQPQTPEDVADAAIRGVERGEIMVPTNLLSRLMVGAGRNASLRQGLGEVLWNLLGSIVVVFVAWDFWSKTRRWGRERGLQTGPGVPNP
ncbi:uncharacterized protein HMPREF1541_03529 [Cyphellophora europaea CBS 101466]|uniref:3-dehydrosphinganine reductase n=1 Tax=Cyphellophora europaea (strain CBS 101466) TaxID=1220924 RepID=W2S0M4_CYPE1|nr:uncharacterized protein HMPREF1541_03529 [Cyphellophora europaea CBS 101466]ETN41593.1 hypothetical protein HMPREF1541_03529 [Cyphellophora europaea CBS 101466]